MLVNAVTHRLGLAKYLEACYKYLAIEYALRARFANTATQAKPTCVGWYFFGCVTAGK